VNIFEDKLFNLLDKFNKLTKEDEAAGTELRNQTMSLMKELSLYRAILEKKKDKDSNVRFINRLEDLQENLADLEYQISNKFGWTKGLGDKAKDLLKNKQLEDAKKQHEQLDTNLFEL